MGRSRRVAALALALVACVSTLAATSRAQSPPALPSVVRAVDAARDGAPIPHPLAQAIPTIRMFPRRYRIPPDCFSHDSSTKTMSKICRVGRPSSKKLLVVFGDSHAFMWLPAILVMARRDDWAVVPLIRFGCTPGKWIPPQNGGVCGEWHRWALEQIRRLHPTATLLTGSIGERPSSETRSATTGLIATARALRPLGRLVVVGDPEGPAFDPRPCVSRPHASLASCMTTWPPSSLTAYDTVARETKRLDIGFLPTRGFVCYRRQCPAVVGRTIVWMDNSHLTGLYSAQLAGPFRGAFTKALQVSSHAQPRPSP